MYPSCPRCGGSLQFVDDPPVFCPHCGLPQLRISEDTTPPARDGAPGHALDASRVDWARALRLTAVAAAAGAVLPALLPGALTGGLVTGMSLLMTPILTAVVIFTYLRRRRAPLAPAAGARIGSLLGLLMGAIIALLTGIAGFVLRYRYHSNAIDAKIDAALQGMPAQLSTGGPPPAELLQILKMPEFRAGTFILGHAISLLVLVGAAALCGSAAAFILQRRPQGPGEL